MGWSLMGRYLVFALCVVALLAVLQTSFPGVWVLRLLFGALVALGVWDLLQPRQAVRRNYSIVGNLRYLVESVRPDLRQYLLESDKDPVPFSREQRALVSAWAKNELAARPFGSRADGVRLGCRLAV